MTFLNTFYLYFLILVPFIFISLVFIQKYNYNKIFKFISKKNLTNLLAYNRKSNSIFKCIFISLSIAFFIISLARPRWGQIYEEVFSSGNHIVIVFDTSKSMLAEDLKPSRLSVAKNNVLKFIDKIGGDKIALVVFSNSSVLLSPLTTDHNILKMYLDIIDTDFLSSGGTSVSKGLQLAAETLIDAENKDSKRIILLVTDGEDHEGNIDLSYFVQNNIKIYALAAGYESGAPIPVYSHNGIKTGYLKDSKGEIVISKVNVNFLKELSLNTSGAVFFASFNEDPVLDLVNLINKENNANSLNEKFNIKDIERYRWSLIPAALFFILGVLL